MIWFSWRHARSENIVIAVTFSIVAAVLIATGVHMASVFDHGGARACLARPDAGGPSCGAIIDAFHNQFGQLENLRGWFNLVPGLIGALLAAPFVLELESGTYRLAWTQSITRRRWLTTKILFIVVGAAVTAVFFVLLFTWWHHPFDRLDSRLLPNTFDLEGITPFAYTLFAAALVLVLGALTRRTAIAVGAGFAVYMGARLLVQDWARRHLLASLRAVVEPGRQPPGLAHAWIISNAQVDRLGHPLQNAFPIISSCANPTAGGVRVSGNCLAQHGIHTLLTYLPAKDFWPLQAIEAALFISLALVLAAAGVWTLTKRPV